MTHRRLSCPKQSAACKILAEVLLCFLNAYLVSNEKYSVLCSHLKPLYFTSEFGFSHHKHHLE